MKPQTARQLLEDGIDRMYSRQTWADLGAGNGAFTHALSTMLYDGSTLYAVDTNAARMESIRVWQQIMLKKIKADFIRDTWSTEPLDGVLMANSLHFVKDKESFLRGLKEKMAFGSRLIIVEYEMEKGNTFVPYPIGFRNLTSEVKSAGFSTVKKLKEVPSVYEGRMIYSALVQ